MFKKLDYLLEEYVPGILAYPIAFIAALLLPLIMPPARFERWKRSDNGPDSR